MAGNGVDLNTQPDGVYSPFLFWPCGSSGNVDLQFNKIPTKEQCGSKVVVVNGVPTTVQRRLNATIYFPQCRNGTNLSSVDGTVWDHVRQVDVNEACPAGFQHRLPQLGFLLYWNIDDVTSTDTWHLSSDQRNPVTDEFLEDPGASLHGDWMAG